MMVAALSGWGGDEAAPLDETDPLALLRSSDLVYGAILHADGTVADANGALERALGGALAGVPATDLVADAQRPAFARLLAAAHHAPQSAVLAFADARGDAASDRRVSLRPTGAGTVVLVAEPAVREEARLVEQVLELNGDLIDTRRRLEHRTSEVEQARQALETANKKLRYLESIGAVALAHHDIDAVLLELLRLIRGCLHADRAAIWLLDPDRGELVATAALGLEEDVDGAVRIPVGPGVPGEIAVTRLPLLIDDLADVDNCSPALRAHGGSFVGVPLRAGEQLVGVAHVTADMPCRFDRSDVALLRLVADRAALAILRAQDYERHRRIGATLQESLLPKRLPTLPGLAVAARYVPGSADAEIGGDWFDAVALPDGRLGVAIGDVAGRGLEAASTMGQLRHAMRAYALEHPRPCDVLHQLDHMAAEMEAVATACYAVLDPRTGEGLLASAGHLPPLVIDNGNSRFLDSVLGTPLGLGAKPCREEHFTVPVGGGLLLYTDGLVEERGEPIDAGLARLRAAAHHGDEEPAALCDRVITALGRDAAGDDVAVLAARRAA